MKAVFILNDSPYGSERCFNALTLAHTLLLSGAGMEVLIYLMGDAVACSKEGQVTSSKKYNLEGIAKGFTADGGKILACTDCMDERGLTGDELSYGIWQGTLDELLVEVKDADRVLTF